MSTSFWHYDDAIIKSWVHWKLSSEEQLRLDPIQFCYALQLNPPWQDEPHENALHQSTHLHLFFYIVGNFIKQFSKLSIHIYHMSAVQGWHACPYGLVYTSTPPGLNLCYCGRQGQAYPSRHTRRGAASLPRLMLDAGGREWARVALKDKELHKPQFFACPPHKSIIYIHIFFKYIPNASYVK